MAVRHLALPEVFTGEGRAHWDDWIDHFERIATVNEWDEANQRKWLPARLSGRAATVYRRLSDEVKADLQQTKDALQERFEPASRKELYRAELQGRKKQRQEDWATYGEELIRIAEKAYPDLPVEAQQRLALNQFLAQLDNPQVAFGVKQRAPETVEKAVQLTLELESYLPTPGRRQPTLPAQEVALLDREEEEDPATPAAVAGISNPKDPLQLILQRLERLETDIKVVKQGSRRTGPRTQQRDDGPIICRRCGQEGHIARGCRTRVRDSNPPSTQGNDKPSGR